MNANSNTATARCDHCGETVGISLKTKEVGREPREMGAEIQFDTTGEKACSCGNKITYLESEWEYPEGVPNYQEGPILTGGTLVS